jgi:hypothetical protein
LCGFLSCKYRSNKRLLGAGLLAEVQLGRAGAAVAACRLELLAQFGRLVGLLYLAGLLLGGALGGFLHLFGIEEAAEFRDGGREF